MTEIQQRTAEQLFRTLGELKGGAMKFGQAMSIFEAALPEDVAAPYRDQLTQLQDSAPPMPTMVVRERIAAALGVDWQDTQAGKARALAKKSGVTYPLVVDSEPAIRAEFLPRLVLVDAQGRIAFRSTSRSSRSASSRAWSRSTWGSRCEGPSRVAGDDP